MTTLISAALLIGICTVLTASAPLKQSQTVKNGLLTSTGQFVKLSADGVLSADGDISESKSLASRAATTCNYNRFL